MPTRPNALGRYSGLAPELQDTLRRNGMQARIMTVHGETVLAVQGHDSPLLTYPLSRERILALTDGGTNSSDRKAYDAFVETVGGDFRLPKDYVHARNAGGRVVMGLDGYRLNRDEYGPYNPLLDMWARRGMLGWAPVVPGRADGSLRPGEMRSGGYGFYYKGSPGQNGNQTGGGEDVLKELREVYPEIQARPDYGAKAKPYSELITSDVYFSGWKWNAILSGHGIVVDKFEKTLTIRSTAINRDLVYDLRDDELALLTSDSLKDAPLQARLDVINSVIGADYDGKVTMEMLDSEGLFGLPLSPAALEDIRRQERSLHPDPVTDRETANVIMLQSVAQEMMEERMGIGRVNGESLYAIMPHAAWFREGAHGREVSVGDIRVEPLQDQESRHDMKYRMTAVINGEEISHEINRRQYDKFMAVDDYHRMRLFSKVFSEVDLKQLPRERREGGPNIGAAILAALTVAGEMARGPRMAPDLYLERHEGGHVYMKPGVDSAQDIASRAFEAGINAAQHCVGLGR